MELCWEPRLDKCREEHSVDRYRCRPELSERFGRHWSIWHMNFRGNSYGPMAPSPYFQGNLYGPMAFVKSFPLDWHWSMDGSSQKWEHRERNSRINSCEIPECKGKNRKCKRNLIYSFLFLFFLNSMFFPLQGFPCFC